MNREYQNELIVNGQMIDNDHFVVEIKLTEEYKGVKAICNNLAKQYKLLGQKILFKFHVDRFNLLNERLSKLLGRYNFKVLPDFILKTFKKLSIEHNNNYEQHQINLSRLDEFLLNGLMLFQKEGIEFGIRKNGKCLLADDIGMGKTRQALGIAQYYRENWPLIIVSPKSVRCQWMESVNQLLTSVPKEKVHQISYSTQPIPNVEILIISYEVLSSRINELTAKQFGFVIFDESHHLKSSKSKRFKAAYNLAEKCNRVLLLSGTPALSRPFELYSQLLLILPNFISTRQFGERYCAGLCNDYGEYVGWSNLAELKLLLKTCMIRRLKTDILSLPTKMREKIVLDSQLVQVSQDLKLGLENLRNNESNRKKPNPNILRYYSATSGAKEIAVCNYLGDLLKRKQKCLVFAHHQHMISSICDFLSQKKIQYVKFDGQVNAEQIKSNVDNFQTNEKILVAVSSIQTGLEGMTVTAVKLVVFAELFWNPTTLLQCEDRTHRIGQNCNVEIHYLIAKDTLDEHISAELKSKVEILSELDLIRNFNLHEIAETEVEPQIDENILEQFSLPFETEPISKEILEIDDSILDQFFQSQSFPKH